jgi:hypothetical protein
MQEPYNLNVGFVMINQPFVVPEVLNMYQPMPQPQYDFFKQNPEVVRLWSNCFAPGPRAPSIHIPGTWADFFTFFLMSPVAHTGAKQFLGSPALPLSGESSSSPTIPFYLPQNAPDQNFLFCSRNMPTSVEVEDSQLPSSVQSSPEQTPEPTSHVAC